MRYIALTAILALTACANNPVTQDRINAGLGVVAASYVCVQAVNGAIKAFPADAAAQAAAAAGAVLAAPQCQAAIASGEAIIQKK